MDAYKNWTAIRRRICSNIHEDLSALSNMIFSKLVLILYMFCYRFRQGSFTNHKETSWFNDDYLKPKSAKGTNDPTCSNQAIRYF